MDKVNSKLTVYFEDPFWIGVFERVEEGRLAVDTVVKEIKRNPKRMQRDARKQMLETGIGTKSQQALVPLCFTFGKRYTED